MGKNSISEIDSNLKLIAKSSIIVLVGVLLSKIFSYAHRIIIAKYFGPEIYGLFSLAMIIFIFFVYLSSLGLFEGILRYVSFYRGKEENNKIRYVLRFSSIVLFISGVLASFFLFFLSDYISINIFHNNHLIIFLKILSFLIIINVFANIFLSMLRAFEKISWYSFIVNILQNTVKLLTLIFFILIGINSNSAIFSFSLGIFSMFVLGYYTCKKKIPNIFMDYKLDLDTQKKIKKELVSYSIPVMFTTLIATIFYWIDSFALGYFENARSVGFYNAAIPIVVLFGIATELFMQLFYPIIVKEFSKKNLDIIKELSQQVGKWILILNIPLFVLVFFFPGAVINLLFGREYLVAESALRILALGGFISIFSGLLIQILLMVSKSRMIFINFLISSGINTILNVILIPKYSLQGAAFATLISWIFLTLILFIEVKLVLGFVPLRRKMLNVVFLSVIPTSLLFLLRSYFVINLLSIILLGLFFTLSYFTLILLTNSLDKNDLMILRIFKNKFFRKRV